MKALLPSWGDRLAAAVALLATVILVWFTMSGCRALGAGAFELCYVHPKYGTVCVEIDGTRHFKATLTPAEREEVEAWIRDQGGK